MKKILVPIFAICVSLFTVSCGAEKKIDDAKDAVGAAADSASAMADSALDVVVEEEVIEFIPVDETSVESVPLNEKWHAAVKANKPEAEKQAAAKEKPVKTASKDDVTKALESKDLTPSPQPALNSNDVVSLTADPINQTLAMTSFGKRKNEYLTVVSSPTDPNKVDQIVFTNKKHTDIYKISPGMPVKEVRKLRKDLKHFVKNGKVFLANDDSNILYMLNVTAPDGKNVYSDAELDNMDVQSVIWNNAKDRKK